MFVDASAIVALLAAEPEAERVSRALVSATIRVTSAVAVLEAALALARPDKFDMSVGAVEHVILELLSERGIEIRNLPPADRAVSLALSAADRYRSGRRGLNLGDCLHYACAKHEGLPILATANEFRQTDVGTVP